MLQTLVVVVAQQTHSLPWQVICQNFPCRSHRKGANLYTLTLPIKTSGVHYVYYQPTKYLVGSLHVALELNEVYIFSLGD
ncbi:hypothetical protein F4825DRAFT_418175 [Nemania diffusa]|nr:hypothetical protein F4825DRAFT_418175 [Nemania diffusa]